MVISEQETQEIKAEKLFDRLCEKLYQELGDEGCLIVELSDSEAETWDESDNVRYNIMEEFDRYDLDFVYTPTAQKLYIHYELVDEDE